MEGLGVGLLAAALVMSPLAVYVLWRSLKRKREMEEAAAREPVVDRVESRDRLSRGLKTGEMQVKEREATGATPLPNFYRNRKKATVERPEPRRYM